MDIRRIARLRAQTMATVEYLTGMPPIGDPEERRAHCEALQAAVSSYNDSEALYRQAVSTLSDIEIAELEGRAA